MALTTFYVPYTTDFGEVVNIKIRYENNETERLQRGGLEPLPDTQCKWTVNRKDLTPRYVETKDFGKVYFGTHANWIEYIQDTTNINNILKAYGEVVNCRLLAITSN